MSFVRFEYEITMNNILYSDYGYGGSDYGYGSSRQGSRGVGKGTTIIHFSL